MASESGLEAQGETCGALASRVFPSALLGVSDHPARGCGSLPMLTCLTMSTVAANPLPHQRVALKPGSLDRVTARCPQL